MAPARRPKLQCRSSSSGELCVIIIQRISRIFFAASGSYALELITIPSSELSADDHARAEAIPAPELRPAWVHLRSKATLQRWYSSKRLPGIPEGVVATHLSCEQQLSVGDLLLRFDTAREEAE